MNTSYTWLLARKILVVFLVITIFSAIAALFIRNSVTKKLADTANLPVHAGLDQSKAEHALLMLHLAENDFQASLLNPNGNKSVDYKAKLSIAFNQIDSLLTGSTDTSKLTPGQRTKLRTWYQKKLKLSEQLLVLKHDFDSLLTVYSGFNPALKASVGNTNLSPIDKETTTVTSNTIKKGNKGLLGRLKDAVLNKNGNSAIETNRSKTITKTDPATQQILAQNKNAYIKRLQQLQKQNMQLLSMQRDLIALNTHINTELENIISSLKDINYHIADEFREMAFKNYQETTIMLNGFYLAALFLVLLFAVLLIVFIFQLNKAEMLLRKENVTFVNEAKQKIDDLVKKIELSEYNKAPSKVVELKEIVELATQNNPAFLTKFNTFDPVFSQNLLKIAPNLIATEIEFCILLRLNFETKEIARYTNTSVRAVEGKKYRIRRKLNIPSDQDINIWMTSI